MLAVLNGRADEVIDLAAPIFGAERAQAEAVPWTGRGELQLRQMSEEPMVNGAPVRAQDSPVGDGLAATRLCPVNVLSAEND